MYKRVDLLVEAGTCWEILHEDRQNALDHVWTNAHKIITTLNEFSPSTNNLINTLQFVALLVAVADDEGDNITSKPDLLQPLNKLLDIFGYNQIEGNLLDSIGTLDTDELEDYCAQVADLRPQFEPNYGHTVLGLIFSVALLQHHCISDATHHVATLFLDDDYDTVPNYADFLLDF